MKLQYNALYHAKLTVIYVLHNQRKLIKNEFFKVLNMRLLLFCYNRRCMFPLHRKLQGLQKKCK